MSEEPKFTSLPGDEIRGMTCCSKGRIGDGHGCYDEAVFRQIREKARSPLLKLLPPARRPDASR